MIQIIQIILNDTKMYHSYVQPNSIDAALSLRELSFGSSYEGVMGFCSTVGESRGSRKAHMKGALNPDWGTWGRPLKVDFKYWDLKDS